MRNTIIPILFLSTLAATSTAETYAAFADVVVEEIWTENNETTPEALFIKRQDGCASGYSNCAAQGAPGFCCRPSQVCSADISGHIACCPSGAVCTGTIGGGAPTATSPPTTTTTGINIPSTSATTTQGFEVGPTGGADGSRSTVPNSYFPFAYIPTTYTNAAACSSAYSSCQSDVASCTLALAGGVGYPVTVGGPNGGVTQAPAATRLDAPAASSVCSSLSSMACFGLQVEACQAYGDGGGTGAAGRRDCRGAMYGIGAGMAIGMAGQMI